MSDKNSGVEEITVPSDGATLHGIVVSSRPSESAPLIIMYLQGGGTYSYSPGLTRIQETQAPLYTVFLNFGCS